MNNNTKIIVFGLDNVLCQTENNDFLNAKPYEDRIALVNELYEKGYRIIIDSERGSNKLGSQIAELYKMTQEQLSHWNLQYTSLRLGVKYIADMYVDDRNMVWSDIEEYLEDQNG
jgi:hypothetical protein